MHIICTILGSVRIAYEDLKESVPSSTNLCMLQLWDKLWEEQKVKSKPMKQLDAEPLPKRLRITQDVVSQSSGVQDMSRTWAIMRIVYNAMCAHLICISHEALVVGAARGWRAFGEVKEYKIHGFFFLLEHITYCEKFYKGEGSKKFDIFQAKQGMQVLHPTIVRCIAFTKELPWITIFPFYNGGSLSDMLLKVPMQYSEFTKAMFHLDHNWKKPPPADQILSQVHLAKLKVVAINMPHIMNALVDGMAATHMAAAHMAEIVHIHLHPFNVVLDFTKGVKARVGIIDWGLLLWALSKWISLNFVYEADKNPTKVANAQAYADRECNKRPWLDPEVYDSFLTDAYTQASDVYALGYLLETLYDF